MLDFHATNKREQMAPFPPEPLSAEKWESLGYADETALSLHPDLKAESSSPSEFQTKGFDTHRANGKIRD